ncbi:hypothetical protein, variant, partial [Sphaeroforma arctica JP610]
RDLTATGSARVYANNGSERDVGHYKISHFGKLHGAVSYPAVGSPEDKVRLAYVIMIHDAMTLLGMQETLDIVYETKHLFVVHVDADTPRNFVDFVTQYYEDVSNIHVLSNVSVQWGASSIMTAERLLYKYAVDIGGWDLCITLCGNAFPVKSPLQIARLVAQNKGLTFSDARRVDPFDREQNRWEGYECLDKRCRKVHGSPDDLPLFKGSQWMALSLDFTRYLVDYSVSDWYNHSVECCIDEYYKQVLVCPYDLVQLVLQAQNTTLRADVCRLGMAPERSSEFAHSQRPTVSNV